MSASATRALAVARAFPLCAACALVLALLFSGWPVNHDSAAYLMIGEMLLSGAVPYVDYVELNPPMVHYLHVLPAALHSLLDVSLPLAFQALVVLWCLFAAVMLGRLLRVGRTLAAPWPQIACGLWILASQFVLCNNGFGQREHLFVVGLAPWLAARSARHQGYDLPVASTLVLTLFTAAFAMMKPHLLAVLLAGECALLLHSRRFRALLSFDAWLIGVVGLAYALHFALVPEAMRDAFFGRFLPLVASSYGKYGTPLAEIVVSLTGVATIVAGALAVAWFVLRRQLGANAWFDALAAATGFGVVSFFVQAKGWPYHAYPALGCGVLLSLAWASRSNRLAMPVAIGGIAASVFAAGLAFALAPYVEVGARTAAVAIAEETQPGETVAFIDTANKPGMTTLLYADRAPAVRYLPAFPIAFFAGADDPALAAEEARFLADLAHDLATRSPTLVVVRDADCLACPPGFSIARWLRESGFVARHLTDFDLVGDTGDYHVYRRRQAVRR